MMVRTSLLILLGSLQLSSVIGEDYIINQERPGWAAVKDGTKEYPWIVRIVAWTKNTNSNTKYKRPLCTGTLISQDRIATAKHCLNKFENFEVEFFKKLSSDSGRFQRKIKYYQIPKSSINSDYAEAVLDRPVVEPAPIDICQKRPKVNEKGLAVGWGWVDLKSTEATYLGRAWLEIINYPGSGPWFKTRVRYGKDNNTIKGTCPGDSGGPILSQRNKKFCIFGTVYGGNYDCKGDPVKGYGIWNDMISMRKELDEKRIILSDHENDKEKTWSDLGVISSPNYPNMYPDNVEETKTIEVEKGMNITLKFTAFDVELGDSSCPYDHLTIEDGDGSTLMEKTCGNSLPENLVSKSNVVKLHFRTDGSESKSGWSVTWSAEKSHSGQDGQGVATSPNYPDKYPNDLRNTTTIEVEKGMIVALKFTAFDVERGDDSCPYDHLTIEDGDGSTLMEKTCGYSLPEDLVSKSNVVKLHFKTDESVTESGWSVTWSAEKPTGI